MSRGRTNVHIKIWDKGGGDAIVYDNQMDDEDDADPTTAIGEGVQVCYAIKTESETYISRVRLTQMTTPDSALVVHDDGTNLTSTSPTCYTSPAKVEVEGTITLALKMVFGSTSDVILIGGIALLTE